jgi:hypothetical protein
MSITPRPAYHDEIGGIAAINGSVCHVSQWVVVAESQPLDAKETARI